MWCTQVDLGGIISWVCCLGSKARRPMSSQEKVALIYIQWKKNMIHNHISISNLVPRGSFMSSPFYVHNPSPTVRPVIPITINLFTLLFNCIWWFAPRNKSPATPTPERLLPSTALLSLASSASCLGRGKKGRQRKKARWGKKSRERGTGEMGGWEGKWNEEDGKEGETDTHF